MEKMLILVSWEHRVHHTNMWIMTLPIAINEVLFDNEIVLCDELGRIVLTRVPTNHMYMCHGFA